MSPIDVNIQTNTYQRNFITDPASRLIEKIISFKNRVLKNNKQKSKASSSKSTKVTDPFMISDYVTQALRNQEIKKLKNEISGSAMFYKKH
jgi:ribosomal protein L11